MSQEQLIDLAPKQLGLLKKIIKQHIPDKTVWVYGSRVTWEADEVSDIDLTVFDCTNVQIDELKETLEESNLLISVDVMNWEEIPDNFKTNIKKQYVVLQEKNKLTGWREVKLGDVAEITRGGSPRPIHDYITPTGTPWVKIADATATNSRYITKTKEFIKPEGELKSRVVYSGDFIVSNSATPGLPRFMKMRACIHDGWLLLREIKNVDKMFLYYLILKERASILSKGSGTIFTNLKTDILKNHVVFLPPLPEQKAIAEVLSSLDDKIDLLHRQNKTLEDMAQTLFRQWFIEQADAGWEVGTLGDILSVKGGTTPSTKNPDYWNGEIHWTTPKDLSNNCPTFLMDTLRKITKKGLDRIGSGLLPAGTLLLSSRAPVGYMAFSAVPIAINQGYIAIIADKGYSNLFIYSWLKLNMSYVKSFANGSTFQEVSKTSFKSLEIVMPEEHKRKKFDDIAKPAFNKIFSNQSQINTLENLRDILLPKLMSGEIGVNN